MKGYSKGATEFFTPYINDDTRWTSIYFITQITELSYCNIVEPVPLHFAIVPMYTSCLMRNKHYTRSMPNGHNNSEKHEALNRVKNKIKHC